MRGPPVLRAGIATSAVGTPERVAPTRFADEPLVADPRRLGRALHEAEGQGMGQIALLLEPETGTFPEGDIPDAPRFSHEGHVQDHGHVGGDPEGARRGPARPEVRLGAEDDVQVVPYPARLRDSDEDRGASRAIVEVPAAPEIAQPLGPVEKGAHGADGDLLRRLLRAEARLEVERLGLDLAAVLCVLGTVPADDAALTDPLASRLGPAAPDAVQGHHGADP